MGSTNELVLPLGECQCQTFRPQPGSCVIVPPPAIACCLTGAVVCVNAKCTRSLSHTTTASDHSRPLRARKDPVVKSTFSSDSRNDINILLGKVPVSSKTICSSETRESILPIEKDSDSARWQFTLPRELTSFRDDHNRLWSCTSVQSLRLEKQPTALPLGVKADASVVSEHSVSELSVSEDSVSEDSVSEDSVSEDSVSEDSVSEDSVSEDSVSEDSVSEDSVSEDSSCCELATIQTAPNSNMSVRSSTNAALPSKADLTVEGTPDSSNCSIHRSTDNLPCAGHSGVSYPGKCTILFSKSGSDIHCRNSNTSGLEFLHAIEVSITIERTDTVTTSSTSISSELNYLEHEKSRNRFKDSYSNPNASQSIVKDSSILVKDSSILVKDSSILVKDSSILVNDSSSLVKDRIFYFENNCVKSSTGKVCSVRKNTEREGNCSIGTNDVRTSMNQSATIPEANPDSSDYSSCEFESNVKCTRGIKTVIHNKNRCSRVKNSLHRTYGNGNLIHNVNQRSKRESIRESRNGRLNDGRRMCERTHVCEESLQCRGKAATRQCLSPKMKFLPRGHDLRRRFSVDRKACCVEEADLTRGDVSGSRCHAANARMNLAICPEFGNKCVHCLGEAAVTGQTPATKPKFRYHFCGSRCKSFDVRNVCCSDRAATSDKLITCSTPRHYVGRRSPKCEHGNIIIEYPCLSKGARNNHQKACCSPVNDWKCNYHDNAFEKGIKSWGVHCTYTGCMIHCTPRCTVCNGSDFERTSSGTFKCIYANKLFDDSSRGHLSDAFTSDNEMKNGEHLGNDRSLTVAFTTPTNLSAAGRKLINNRSVTKLLSL